MAGTWYLPGHKSEHVELYHIIAICAIPYYNIIFYKEWSAVGDGGPVLKWVRWLIHKETPGHQAIRSIIVLETSFATLAIAAPLFAVILAWFARIIASRISPRLTALTAFSNIRSDCRKDSSAACMATVPVYVDDIFNEVHSRLKCSTCLLS